EESGLASGIVNTSYQIGSALGLAIIVALASAQTLHESSSGLELVDAMNSGFHIAFIAAAIVTAAAAVVAWLAIKKSDPSGTKEGPMAAA
ncbi:MAG TPA: hypothetical protein VJ742_10370, partial [Nitrososphaera sp.]|nr:hypothetical protein [Nitrososphaera sp.]